MVISSLAIEKGSTDIVLPKLEIDSGKKSPKQSKEARKAKLAKLSEPRESQRLPRELIPKKEIKEANLTSCNSPNFTLNILGKAEVREVVNSFKPFKDLVNKSTLESTV